jgi:hypothetical protein
VGPINVLMLAMLEAGKSPMELSSYPAGKGLIYSLSESAAGRRSRGAVEMNLGPQI